MSFDDLFNILFRIQIWDVVKVILEIALLIYVIFALITIRQVELMGKVVGITLTPALRLVAIVHLFVSVGILVLALLIL